MEILEIIYSYTGNNFLITNDFYKYIMECRSKFYNDPIKIRYRLAEWRYRGQPNKMILNKLSGYMTKYKSERNKNSRYIKYTNWLYENRW